MKSSQSVLTLIFCLAMATAEAALESRLGGQAAYDTDLGITWLTDANLCTNNSFGLNRNVDLGPNIGVTNYGPSLILSDGSMTWGGALKWIAAMNATNYLGYNDWRLPTTQQPDPNCGVPSGTFGASYGVNCILSEMGHLFYQELGGVAGSSIVSTHNAAFSLFQNIRPVQYWSGTDWPAVSDYAWRFEWDNGNQRTNPKNNASAVMVVRSGDVAPVRPPDYNVLSGQLQSNGAVRLSYVGLAGTNYAVEQSFRLVPPNWVAQGTNTAGADGVLWFTNTPNKATNNFWRIRSIP